MSLLLAKNLRSSVLQAAIEGKLTIQLESDGNAKTLIKDIQIKSDLKTINEQDIPFDIPKNWVWTRLGNIGESNIGLTYSPENVTNFGTIVLRSGNIKNGKLDFSDIVRVQMDIPKSKMCRKGDLLICSRNGSKSLVGKTAIIDRDGYCFGAFMSIFRSEFNHYIYYYLSSPFFREDFDGLSTSTINQITQDNLKNRLVPLPPIAEQKRIITRIEELMVKIDEYERIENHLFRLQTKFPGEMKASLLQAAMEGKLIGQNWNIDDNPEKYTPIWKLTAWDKKFKSVSRDKQKEIRKYHYYLAAEMKAVEKQTGDVFLLSTGDYSGWTTEEAVGNTVCDGEIVSIPWGGYPNVKYFKGKFITSDNRIATSTDLEVLSNRYLYYFMLSQVDYLDSIYRGTGLRHPDMSAVLDMQIPLPSLREQEIIVKKLDVLLPLCESLKTK